MRHCRSFLLLITLLLSGAVLNNVSAQNNIYGIADECYTLYDQAELALGTPEAQDYITQLAETSVRIGDQKAHVLASVLQLRQQLTEDDFFAVMQAFQTALNLSEQTGYIQYYFYSYTLLATHHFNSGQQLSSLELVRQMQEDAIRMDSEYGRWNCSKFLGQIYLSTMRYDMARKYLTEAIAIHDSTDDPIIRTQPLTRVFTDLSETLEFGTPEHDECLLAALEHSRSSLDSLRVAYYSAKALAVKRDFDGFHILKEECLADSHFSRVISDGEMMFDLTEAVIRRDWTAVDLALDSLKSYSANKYVASLATASGNSRVTAHAQQNMLSIILSEGGEQYNTILSEISARMDNDKLKEQLLEKTNSLNRLLKTSIILFFFLVIIFVIVITRYISQLQLEKKHADASNLAKTNFVQNMSHEIRTPLNAIVGFSQLLALPDGMLTDAERTQYGSYIQNSSSMLTMLIDDILEISDVDSGRYKVSLAPCCCNDVCRHAMSSVSYRVPPGVEYNFHSELSDDFTIISDERRIEQVVINFLTNACKHTSKGEILVECGLTDHDSKLRIAVTDTGTGVPPANAKEIFQRFAKLDRYKQGSGLGLNICCIIAENLHGRVFLDTDYGRCSGKSDRGARFVFEIDLNAKPDHKA